MEAERCIQSIGRALFEDLKQGKTDTIPGLGSFRIVRVAESRTWSMAGLTGSAYNVVEFSPEDSIADAANDANVEAARVFAFQYFLRQAKRLARR